MCSFRFRRIDIEIGGRTGANQPRDLCVRGHFPVRDLLDRLIHGEEEGLGLFSAGHYFRGGVGGEGISIRGRVFYRVFVQRERGDVKGGEGCDAKSSRSHVRKPTTLTKLPSVYFCPSMYCTVHTYPQHLGTVPTSRLGWSTSFLSGLCENADIL
jgi:hypothetical protein